MMRHFCTWQISEYRIECALQDGNPPLGSAEGVGNQVIDPFVWEQASAALTCGAAGLTPTAANLAHQQVSLLTNWLQNLVVQVDGIDSDYTNVMLPASCDL